MSQSYEELEQQALRYAQRKRQAVPLQQYSPRRAYELIRAGIRSGLVRSDEPILEHALIQALGTSRNSVRQALRMLADEGILTRGVRNGTRVARGISKFAVDAMVPPEMLDGELGDHRIEEMYRGKVTASDIVRERLGVTSEEVLMIEYLAILNDDPLYVRTIYFPLPADGQEFLDRAELLIRLPIPLHASFQALHGVPMGASEAILEAVPCEGRTAVLLGVAVAVPVLLHELALWDRKGAVRELSYTHYRGDRVAVTSKVASR